MGTLDRRAEIDRVSASDLVTLVTDHGPVPMNLGAALVLLRGDAPDYAAVRSALESRLPRVPRLRRRLTETPFGGGRPVWVDDASFDLDHHLSRVDLSAPSARVGRADHPGRAARQTDDPRDADGPLLAAVAALVTTPLSRDRPLWAARCVTGWEPGAAALVLVVHHSMADGIGGLAVLAALRDAGGTPAAAPAFPQPAPSWRALCGEAFHDRARGVTRLPRRWRASADGGHRPTQICRPRRAARTSLNRPTGPRRRPTTVTVAMAPVADVAHRCAGTVNDMVLTAVSGALGGLLRHHGEAVPWLLVSEPVSSRRTASAGNLGNRTGVVVLPLPTDEDQEARFRKIHGLTRTHHERRPQGPSGGFMGLAFRALAALRVFQPFIDHQRFVHTFVSNVRAEHLALVRGARGRPGHPGRRHRGERRRLLRGPLRCGAADDHRHRRPRRPG